jgi:Putative transposase
VREPFGTPESERVVDACDETYPHGCGATVPQGDGPSRSQSFATSRAQEVVRPPSSLRRIERSEGQRVTSHYRSQKSERVEQESVDVFPFIGRMMQHPLAQGCNRMRSYGVPATKPLAKSKAMMQAALAQVKGLVHGALKISAAQRSRARYRQSPGREPWIWPHCPPEMGLWKIGHPQYGVVYDERATIKRGR